MVGEGPQPKVMKKLTLEEKIFHNSIKFDLLFSGSFKIGIAFSH
jgi:hypothetical protein